jgi:ABC-type multidrug transport system ATPase subunit
VTELLVGVGGAERRFDAGGPAAIVGRDPLCQVVVDDPLVSRQHLALEWADGHWWVRDLGSSNGTFLDGRRVHRIPVGQRVALLLGNASTGVPIQLRPACVVSPTAVSRGPGGVPETVVPGRPDGAPATVPRPVLGMPPPAARTPNAPPASPAPAGPAPQVAVVPPSVVGRTPSGSYRAGEVVRIGRDAANDIVLTDLLVSRRHAELRRVDRGYEVVDLGTRNGTFVNGQRVSFALLRPGDVVGAGHHQLVFDGTMLHEYVDTGRVSLRAESLTVTAGPHTLLAEVGFELPESSLLAVVGPSGAGKSTLLGALTGIRPATRGTVRYQERDLYAEYDDLRHRIGLVPQDDILHRQLTVRRALRYAAALRFGADVSARERDQRIDEVLAKLGLTERADQRISTLSGGQRKRTSVALELLTEPSLLFLDEPTSGLDPALDRDVMLALRDLADGGRTVCVVTHSVLHLNLCDRILVLGRGGRVCYFGPPDGLLAFFGAQEYAEVFERVATEPEAWADRFRQQATPRTRVEPTARIAPPPPAGDPDGPGAASSRQGFWRQLAIVARRTIAVTLADRLYASLLVGLPLGLALLAHLVPGDDGLAKPANALHRSAEAGQLLTILVIGGVFMGLAGGIRELVAERAIYRRERAVGLSPGAYLGAKLVVFAVLNAAQATVFVLVALWGAKRPAAALVLGSPTVELVAAVALVTLASTVLGLLISAYVSTSEQTMPVLVGLVMAQLVLSGGLFAVAGRAVVSQLSWLAPARWAYAAAAATVDLTKVMPDPPDDTLWDHSSGRWLTAAGVLVGQTVLLLIATRLALRRHEPGR